MNAIGLDISFWQTLPVGHRDRREIDFGMMRENASFVIIRAGQNLWKDREFAINRRGAMEAGLPHGSYWFYDSRADPVKQADLWLDILGGEFGELGLWMDFEDNYGGAFHGMSHWRKFAERLMQRSSARLGVYTAYYYWMWTTGGKADWFLRFPLWVANYGTTKPLVPKPWGDWTLWQFTDKGDARRYGIYNSASCDLNEFNGNEQAFRKFFGIGGVTPPPEPQTSGITIRMGA
jgi:GH25 family lysozyme M1 (1,4-beta-N-acetylmuramidase)